MATFYLYMGLPGSGKTYLAHKHATGEYDFVIDSDEVRESLFGDASYQGDNDKVFRTMYDITVKGLREGDNIFYVATNLSMKKRIALVKRLKKEVPGVKCRCVCVVAPIDVCHRRNGARERIVPEEVIDRMARQFDPPCESEGWDTISIQDNYYDNANNAYDGKEEIYCNYYRQKMKEFGSQQNSHHSLSLSDHCDQCFILAFRDPDASIEIKRAAAIHDVGKLYTQTHWEKDNYSEAHYPNHAELGSYLALEMGYSLYVAQLVRFHMVPYMDAAAQKTWRERMGEELWNDVMRLHQYDEAAH